MSLQLKKCSIKIIFSTRRNLDRIFFTYKVWECPARRRIKWKISYNFLALIIIYKQFSIQVHPWWREGVWRILPMKHISPFPWEMLIMQWSRLCKSVKLVFKIHFRVNTLICESIKYPVWREPHFGILIYK